MIHNTKTIKIKLLLQYNTSTDLQAKYKTYTLLFEFSMRDTNTKLY